jgi:hypothetical protein
VGLAVVGGALVNRFRPSPLADVDSIAVTSGPGLPGALLVGVAAAKGYALAAHVAVDTLEYKAAAGADNRPAGKRRALVATASRRLDEQGDAAGVHDRRRGGGVVPQGGPTTGDVVPGRPAGRPGGARRQRDDRCLSSISACLSPL